MKPLGILTLDNPFPRIPGDVGCAETFAFPVRYAQVDGASVDEVAHGNDPTLLPRIITAGRQLADDGCIAITTTCGYLLRWQFELARELPAPVLTSALLQAPVVERTLPEGRHVGILTYSAASLHPDLLAAAGVRPYAPIEGVTPGGYYARAVRNGAGSLDAARMAEDVVAAARRLVGAHPHIGAVILECPHMPPYAEAVKAAVGLPVYDAAQLIRWFYAGVMELPARHSARNLW